MKKLILLALVALPLAGAFADHSDGEISDGERRLACEQIARCQVDRNADEQSETFADDSGLTLSGDRVESV